MDIELKNKPGRGTRNSNLELYRIIVMLLIVVNILASRNRDSGAVETYIPDTETAFDWLNYHS